MGEEDGDERKWKMDGGVGWGKEEEKSGSVRVVERERDQRE